MIASAKEQWAMDNRKNTIDEPTPEELVNIYIKGESGHLPTCPGSGSYTIGAMGDWPSCTVGTNATSEENDDHVYFDRGG
jgi:hypothetical protein